MLVIRDTLDRKHAFNEQQGLERAYVSYGPLHKSLIHQAMRLPGRLFHIKICAALGCPWNNPRIRIEMHIPLCRSLLRQQYFWEEKEPWECDIVPNQDEGI